MPAAKPLSDPEELLHRQVHPAFIRDGRVGSQAFKPTLKDVGKLSVSRGAVASAQQAFMLYTQELKLPSAGAWSVTVAECSSLDLPVYPDPLVEPVEDPSHALVDFSRHKGSQITRLAKRLAALARDRGCQHPI